MTKSNLFQLFLLIPILTYSQSKFLEIQNTLKEGNRKVHTAFPIVDNDTGNFAIFLDDNNKVYGFLYNADHSQIGNFASEGLPKKYNEIIGYTLNGRKVRLFLKDKKNKTFGSVLFDFETGNTLEKLYDFKLKKEFYVEGYTDANAFYLITITKESSLLNLYVFKEGENYRKETIDLSSEIFFNEHGARKNLNEIMAAGGSKQPFASAYSFTLGKIDEDSPNSIEITSEPVKMYPKDSGFMLTIDHDLTTYVIDISIPNLGYRVSSIQKPSIDAYAPNTNSYIHDGKIYLIAASSDEMKFSVKELESDQELKTIHLNKNQEITFKNTPIIQEGGMYNDYREMEKTSKFLRRIGKEDIGVSVLKSDNDHIITLGSKREVARGGGAMMMPGFGAFPVATAGALTVTFNPTYFAYGAYSTTKATRIECLFDENFNHVEGEIPQNVFDRIKETADRMEIKHAETVFKLDNQYIWGYYSKKVNQYILYKF